MYRSYSVNNMPTAVTHRNDKKPEAEKSAGAPPAKNEKPPLKERKKAGFLDNLQSDDIILLVVILILLMDDCGDKMLLAALGIVFMADIL